MSMTGWSPWIEHDGSGPRDLPFPVHIQLAYPDDDLIRPEAWAPIASDAPNWFWHWTRVRVGRWWWPRIERRPVCDDPAHSPILFYRYRKPPAVTMLQRIAASPQHAPEFRRIGA
ncbi:MAG: hypothetical protein QM699_07585 [Amaricoccus sp.]|uniref:hypothetical protein n=1 Tax=Amaricoccus sp. TaxID=1872485 RepID=UPI0039E6F03F